MDKPVWDICAVTYASPAEEDPADVMDDSESRDSESPSSTASPPSSGCSHHYIKVRFVINLYILTVDSHAVGNTAFLFNRLIHKK